MSSEYRKQRTRSSGGQCQRVAAKGLEKPLAFGPLGLCRGFWRAGGRKASQLLQRDWAHGQKLSQGGTAMTVVIGIIVIRRVKIKTAHRDWHDVGVCTSAPAGMVHFAVGARKSPCLAGSRFSASAMDCGRALLCIRGTAWPGKVWQGVCAAVVHAFAGKGPWPRV